MKLMCEAAPKCPVDNTMDGACCAGCVSVQVCKHACDDAKLADVSDPDFCNFVEESE